MTDTAFSSSRNWRMWLGIAGVIVLLDQAAKHVIVILMPYGASYGVTSFFNLVHTRNTGAAFSLLADAGGWQRYALTALGIGVSAVLVVMLRRGVEDLFEALAYCAILGGALGNVIDRITLGYVTDFLDFHWRGWHWPAFNLADVSITLGACALIFAALRSSPRPPSQSVPATERAPPLREHK